MPSCLGAVRVGPSQADPPVGLPGHRGPDLLAVQQPSRRRPRSARVVREARSEPGPGLGEELAPLDARPAESGGPTGPAARRAVGDDHRKRPRPHSDRADVTGRRRPAPASITSCSTAVGVTAPRARPVRNGQPRIDQCPAAVRTFGTPQVLEDRSQLGAAPIRLLGEVSGERTASAAPGCGRSPRSRERSVSPSNWRAARARLRWRCASCSQVKPMPPRSWMQSLAQST